jgi:hypothetical protein
VAVLSSQSYPEKDPRMAVVTAVAVYTSPQPPYRLDLDMSKYLPVAQVTRVPQQCQIPAHHCEARRVS